MNKDFQLFQKYFKEYQQKFGLTGYKVYFKHEELDGAFASLSFNQNDMVATVRLNSKLPEKDEAFCDIKSSAKHEALHLLLARLESRGKERYIFYEDIYEATEEIVFKLEGLIE